MPSGHEGIMCAWFPKTSEYILCISHSSAGGASSTSSSLVRLFCPSELCDGHVFAYFRTRSCIFICLKRGAHVEGGRDLPSVGLAPKHLQCSSLGQARARSPDSILVSHTSGRNPSNQAITCRLPGAVLLRSWIGNGVTRTRTGTLTWDQASCVAT